MTPPEDEDAQLREAFRMMARHDSRRAPEFAALLARAAPRPAWQKAVPVASALALAACVLLGLRLGDERSAPSSAAPVAVNAGGALEAAPAATTTAPNGAPAAAFDPAPLDFLLTLPAVSALDRVPAFAAHDTFPLPGQLR